MLSAIARTVESTVPRVLIVDDDGAIRTLLSTVLKRRQYELALARNGLEAIEAIGSSTFDAIILDLMMPKVDGFEVIDYLERLSPGLPERRVIILTAAAGKDLRKLDGQKVFRVIRKPFDLDELVEAVNECTKQRSTEDDGLTSKQLTVA